MTYLIVPRIKTYAGFFFYVLLVKKDRTFLVRVPVRSTSIPPWAREVDGKAVAPGERPRAVEGLPARGPVPLRGGRGERREEK